MSKAKKKSKKDLKLAYQGNIIKLAVSRINFLERIIIEAEEASTEPTVLDILARETSLPD